MSRIRRFSGRAGSLRYPEDLYYSFVQLLIYGNGPHDSTVITDSSWSPKAITANGNARISKDQSLFGGSSLYFDGNGDYLTVATSSSLELQSGDFTVEGWVRPASVSGDHMIVYRGGLTVSNANDIQFSAYTSGTNLIVRPYASTTDYNIVAGTVAADTWYHFALTRLGTTFMGFLNGIKSGTTRTISGSLNNNAVWYGCILGDMNISGTHSYLNGNVYGLRITKGICRYSNNFRPPIEAFASM